MKLFHYVSEDGNTELYYFMCPGCKITHPIHVKYPGHATSWSFNGDVNKPTFSPSLLVYPTHRNGRCHSFIRDGQIQYQNDCDHELKGKTVDMPEYSDDR